MTPARYSVLVALLAGLSAAVRAQPAGSATAAQRSPEAIRTMQLITHNQLGLLQFCQAQGAVAGDVVALQRDQLGRLPAGRVEDLANLEEAGRQGIIVFDSSRVAMAEAASAQGISVKFRCEQLARAVEAQSGIYPR